MTHSPSMMTAFFPVLALTVSAQAQVAERLAAQIEDIEVAAASLPSTSLDLVSPGMLLQDGQPAADGMVEVGGENGWVVSMGPYIWLPAKIEGDVSAGGITMSLDVSLEDIFDSFTVFALSGRAEAWKDNTWGVIIDGLYISLDGDFGGSITRTTTKEIQHTLSGPEGLKTLDISKTLMFSTKFDADLDVDVDEAVIDLAMGWRVFDDSVSRTDEEWPRVQVDLIGGMRYWYYKSEMRVSGTVTLTGSAPLSGMSEKFNVKVGGSKDWIEPMIGGRVGVKFNDKWGLGVRGDVSGFGIGSATDLTWNALAGVSTKWSPTFSTVIGWRAQGVDYENGSGLSEFGMDLTIHGPYLGASWVF